MRTTLLIVLSLLSLQAQAATYRWVDADGRVNYGDRPPPDGAWMVRDDTGNTDPAQPRPAGSLPYAVSSAANRYPVRLYTTRECPACDAARAQLIQRGIPFDERTLGSEADAAAFRRMGFTDLRMPALSVGRERTQGHTADEWNLLLDAAGYPKTSMLPRGWRPAPAQPLAAQRENASAPSQRQASEQPLASERPLADEQSAAGERSPTRGEPLAERPYATPEQVRRAPATVPAEASRASRVRF
jgi:glutaredoxin